ncbi:AraC family transcriptional regulator [Parapusillimonas granuli]|uniref:Helix-turn-helix transcriptional regulator n=1 Tax=Parapusillimonas granuli TaxID=380911 RepID=A0A853G4F1_9BURK|nr:helix-turn-helix transcriptional regulator [Parapusillimonas granuli]MBB5215284.1 quercetin dioxygenase-like cupin family protein [Parapusillimonas granuli]NYT49601.1 helix-turn-helix transcriptional regulator [Parapusillimonas granuli]
MDTLILQAGPHAISPVVLPDADAGPMLVARRRSFPAGARIDAHQHVRGQFLFAAAGTMLVRTPGHAWLVPPSRALWIPAGTEHAIDAYGGLDMRTLYLNAASAETLPRGCVVLEVTALLRELIMRMTSPESLDGTEAIALIGRLAVLEIGRLQSCALQLPMPASPDLLGLCERVLKNPARVDGEPVSASSRSLYRRFRAETGLSYVQWRKQACLLHAVRLLGAGQPVTQVALDLGYESPSAFSTMFRRSLGVTPRAFSPRHTKT